MIFSFNLITTAHNVARSTMPGIESNFFHVKWIRTNLENFVTLDIIYEKAQNISAQVNFLLSPVQNVALKISHGRIWNFQRRWNFKSQCFTTEGESDAFLSVFWELGHLRWAFWRITASLCKDFDLKVLLCPRSLYQSKWIRLKSIKTTIHLSGLSVLGGSGSFLLHMARSTGFLRIWRESGSQFHLKFFYFYFLTVTTVLHII